MKKLKTFAALLTAFASQVHSQILDCPNCIPATPAAPQYFGFGWIGLVTASEEELVLALPQRWGNCNTTFPALAPWTIGAWIKGARGTETGLLRFSFSVATAVVGANPGPSCVNPPGSYPAPVERREFATCPAGYTPWSGITDVPLCEGPPKKKVVVIDPGHGLTCPQVGERIGAEGATEFPASNPPAGRLKEDVVTVEVALEVRRIMTSPATTVLLTKADINSCPTLRDRQRFATDHEADVLVSVHVDARQPPIVAHGTLAIHFPGSFLAADLATRLTGEVANRLGLNNRGVVTNSNLAMVKPSHRISEARVLLELGRMSGQDEQVLHQPSSRGRAALGIKSAIDGHLSTRQ